MRGVFSLFFVLASLNLGARVIKLNHRNYVEGRSIIEKYEFDDEVSYQFSVKEFEVSEGKQFNPLKERFNQISVTGLNNSKLEGAPELPFYSTILVGNKESLISKLSIEEGGVEVFSDYVPNPAPNMPCRCLKNKYKSGRIIERYFRKALPIVELIDIGKYRGISLTKLILRPFQYDRNNGLQIFPELKATFSGNIQEFKSIKQPSNKKFLVISSKSLDRGTLDFVELKREQGFNVDLYFYEDIGGTTAKLTSFIKREYRQQQYSFATIIGHESLIPPHFISTSNSETTPSDFPFFAMDGKNDVFPEIQYSRIVAKNNQDIRNQVYKIREYIEQSYRDDRGLKNHMGIASDEGFAPSDKEYLQQMFMPLHSEYLLNSIPFLQEDSSAVVKNILDAFNNGAIFFNYIGHGSGFSWPSIFAGEFTTDDIKKFNPDIVKPIVIDVACQNGRFNLEGRIGERMMNEVSSGGGGPVGALAYYGGSVDISWDPPAIMAIAINEYISKNKRANLYSAILEGQRYLVESYDDLGSAKENLRWYHLFGDPSLPVDL